MSLKFMILPTLALGLLGLAGCSGHHNHSDYVPPEGKARKALETALSAWQTGQKIGTIDGTPALQPVDVRWTAGRKLGGYEILSTEPGEGLTWFSVRLKLTGPAKEETVRYVVLGIDPLWVCSEEGYKQMTGS